MICETSRIIYALIDNMGAKLRPNQTPIWRRTARRSKTKAMDR